MSASPAFKIYTKSGEYIAACKHAEDAAAIVALNGDGATIRYGHAKRDIVWTEGEAGDGAAAESYDHVAEVAHQRIGERHLDRVVAGANIAAKVARNRIADRVDGFDRDDIGESPDY